MYTMRRSKPLIATVTVQGAGAEARNTDLQITRKRWVGYSTRPPIHWWSGLRVNVASVTYFNSPERRQERRLRRERRVGLRRQAGGEKEAWSRRCCKWNRRSCVDSSLAELRVWSCRKSTDVTVQGAGAEARTADLQITRKRWLFH
jgi:hypothetical protein